MFLPAGVTAKTRFRNLLRRFVLERNDLGGIAFFNVGPAWAVTRLTARHLVFPAANPCQVSVGSMREILELVLVTSLTSLGPDVILRLECPNLVRTPRLRFRRSDE